MRKLNVNSVVLNGKSFNFSFVPAIPNAPPGAVGYNNCNTQHIFVLENQAEDSKKDTVLHEILHVLDYEYQLSLKERQIHCLAAGIFSVLKANKELGKWLIS